MSDKPKDRPEQKDPETAVEPPRIFLIVGEKKFPRPGLETCFAEASGEGAEDDDSVPEVYCSCNKVRRCSCVPVCTCQAVCGCVGNCSCVSHRSCSCVGHSSGGGVAGCRCAPVH